MTLVDNYEILKDLLDFDGNLFYHLQILKRKKENPELKSNSLIISQYAVDSLDYLDYLLPTLKAICTSTNSRAYLNLNPKSIELAALETNLKIGRQLINKDFRNVKNAYQSVMGSLGTIPGRKRRWIIDCDDMTEKEVIKRANSLKEHRPVDVEKVLKIVRTISGYHIITIPFDTRTCGIPKSEIQKNNPTLLYYHKP